MVVPILRTSEFWVGLIAVALQFLVSQHIVTPAASEFVKMAVVYTLGRLLGKAAKATIN